MYLLANLFGNLFTHNHPSKAPLIYVAIGTIVVLLAIVALCSHKKK